MINKNYKYRIKTEKEFRKEFGRNWKNHIQSGYVSEMYEHLGEVFELKDINSFNIERYLLNDGRFDLSLQFGLNLFTSGWNYSSEMFKEIMIEPDYITPKMLVYD